MENGKRFNHLKEQSSPYLRQHATNPVDWYPWGAEAFDKARTEDKPVFLSIGYSTCHWCHVMARESFEDTEIAGILNRDFVCVKVDREERPDVDSVYMTVCQAFTGSGGWPTSIFMTADQKPFFAGTYFPKSAGYGSMGFRELLMAIREAWKNDRTALLDSAETLSAALSRRETPSHTTADERLPQAALDQFKRSFDRTYGGFGDAPKFPAAHDLLFLMTYYRAYGDEHALYMAERTLEGMYRGGLFDHIGYGFCRYSTDRYYLVPHFEKMLYDNALLILAYARAYELTKKPLYLEVAEKTAAYVLGEMMDISGAFLSAQDADSDGEEGKYYLFTPQEIMRLLGQKDGEAFCKYYGITETGNFEGRSIPNRLGSAESMDDVSALRLRVRDYRRERTSLHTDDKVLCSWNALMIAALCALYRVSRKQEYLDAAMRAQRFIESELSGPEGLYASYRAGRRGEAGFLEDYANYIFALLSLYHASLDEAYLVRAQTLVKGCETEFFDGQHGGFYLYGNRHEKLLLRPKESHDGAMPSGNAMMTVDLVRLHLLEGGEADAGLRKQLAYMRMKAETNPMGHAMFLCALIEYSDTPPVVTAVIQDMTDVRELPFLLPTDAVVRLLRAPTDEYPLANGKTTYYVCRDRSCLPPVNTLDADRLLQGRR